jgi:hypothetical protein
MSGGAKRKIRLANEHMNLQPSAPVSGQKMRKVKPFVFRVAMSFENTQEMQ